MKNLSLKLKDNIFNEAERVVKKIKVPRNSYFNRAIDFYNRLHKRNSLKKELHKESELVAAESMNVLKEFETLD